MNTTEAEVPPLPAEKMEQTSTDDAKIHPSAGRMKKSAALRKKSTAGGRKKLGRSPGLPRSPRKREIPDRKHCTDAQQPENSPTTAKSSPRRAKTLQRSKSHRKKSGCTTDPNHDSGHTLFLRQCSDSWCTNTSATVASTVILSPNSALGTPRSSGSFNIYSDSPSRSTPPVTTSFSRQNSRGSLIFSPRKVTSPVIPHCFVRNTPTGQRLPGLPPAPLHQRDGQDEDTTNTDAFSKIVLQDLEHVFIFDDDEFGLKKKDAAETSEVGLPVAPVTPTMPRRPKVNLPSISPLSKSPDTKPKLPTRNRSFDQYQHKHTHKRITTSVVTNDNAKVLPLNQSLSERRTRKVGQDKQSRVVEEIRRRQREKRGSVDADTNFAHLMAPRPPTPPKTSRKRLISPARRGKNPRAMIRSKSADDAVDCLPSLEPWLEMSPTPVGVVQAPQEHQKDIFGNSLSEISVLTDSFTDLAAMSAQKHSQCFESMFSSFNKDSPVELEDDEESEAEDVDSLANSLDWHQRD